MFFGGGGVDRVTNQVSLLSPTEDPVRWEEITLPKTPQEELEAEASVARQNHCSASLYDGSVLIFGGALARRGVMLEELGDTFTLSLGHSSLLLQVD